MDKGTVCVKKYFYLASPHTFKYAYYVRLIFKKKNDYFVHRGNHSKWIEVKNYNYYGEPVKCMFPAQKMEYDFVFGLLYSKDNETLFGAINYLLYNHRERFIQQVNAGMCPNVAADIIYRYFRKTGDGLREPF